MARVTTKVDLITSANGQFEKMWKLIDSMTEEQQTAIFAEKMVTMGKEAHWSRDKNLRDVLVHLYEWHQLLLNWIISNRAGERKSGASDSGRCYDHVRRPNPHRNAGGGGSALCLWHRTL